jgi:hypothetical protein
VGAESPCGEFVIVSGDMPLAMNKATSPRSSREEHGAGGCEAARPINWPNGVVHVRRRGGNVASPGAKGQRADPHALQLVNGLSYILEARTTPWHVLRYLGAGPETPGWRTGFSGTRSVDYGATFRR